MSFVTTRPEALSAAAAELQGIGSTMAAQNAAAAAPTTGVVPAAADEVSALQAGLFAAYGTLYQRISAEANAVQEMFVNTLRSSAETYDDTEGLNTAAAAPSAPGGLLSSLLGLFSGGPASNPVAGSLSNSAILAAMQGSNWGSAASEFTGLGKGYITAHPSQYGYAGSHYYIGPVGPVGASSPILAGAAASPAAPAPANASAGRAPSIGKLSVPPAWAAQAAQAAQATHAAQAASVTAPAGALAPAHGDGPVSRGGGPVVAIPAGVPSTNSGGRPAGFGMPRYGVKPTVMRHRKN